MEENIKPFFVEEGEFPIIYILIRFLKAKYVDEFLDGKLRLGSVKNYIENYQQEPGKRNDEDEFLSEVHQPDKVVLEINGHRIEGLAGPIRLRRTLDHRSYILCMSALTDRYLNENAGEVKLSPELVSLGEKAVLIVNVPEFHKRIQSAIKKSGFLLGYPDTGGKITGLVEYIDLNTYHGEIGPYRKSNEYSFQMEWRLAVIDAIEREREYPTHLYLEVGDLRDITAVVHSEHLLANPLKFSTSQPE